MYSPTSPRLLASPRQATTANIGKKTHIHEPAPSHFKNHLSTGGKTFPRTLSNWGIIALTKPIPLKSGTTVAVVGVGLLAWLLYSVRSAAGALNFFPDKVKQIAIDGATPIITIGILVQNTSGTQFTLNSIAGNLYADGYLVGNVSSFVQQVIRPNSQAVVLLQIRLSAIGVVQEVIRAFQSHSTTVNLELDATANVNNNQVSVDLNYKVGG